MPRSIDCPVCPKREIPFGERRCPGCGTDLSPLLRLAELPYHYVNQALSCHARGDREGALAAARCALALEPQCDAAALLSGKLLWHSGKKAQARSHWSDLLAQRPDHAEARRLLSASTHDAGPFERVKKLLGRNGSS